MEKNNRFEKQILTDDDHRDIDEGAKFINNIVMAGVGVALFLRSEKFRNMAKNGWDTVKNSWDIAKGFIKK